MSEIDEVKEQISFYKTIWTTVVALIAALVGWFVLYEKQDVISVLALLAIVVLVIIWVWLHFSITGMIKKLRDL